MGSVELVEATAATWPERQEALRGLLDAWYEQAQKLWEITAKIGDELIAAKKALGDENWPAWLTAIGLSPYQAFVFMRSSRYPELMRLHRPENMEAVSRLLPQGQGEAFDAEQAALARRLSGSGMARGKLRVYMGVSDMTLTRWLDPDRYAKRLEKSAERQRLRRGALEDQRERRRVAALKAKGGPMALAYSQVQASISTVDAAWREATPGSDDRRGYSSALDALYKAKDKLLALGAL
jgi:hypothetical protein